MSANSYAFNAELHTTKARAHGMKPLENGIGFARYFDDLRGFSCYLVYNRTHEGGQSYVMVTHGSG